MKTTPNGVRRHGEMKRGQFSVKVSFSLGSANKMNNTQQKTMQGEVFATDVKAEEWESAEARENRRWAQRQKILNDAPMNQLLPRIFRKDPRVFGFRVEK